MTIAIAILVTEGLVVATDSATTMKRAAGGVTNVYDGGKKLFNLHKGQPIAAATFGAGSIGIQTISTLAKDFRELLRDGMAIGPAAWSFRPESYTCEDVAIALRHFLFEDKYQAAVNQQPGQPPGALGIWVGGYSAGADSPELWEILIDDNGKCDPPQRLRAPGEFGMNWQGDPEAVSRLVTGFGRRTPEALLAIGVQPSDVDKVVLGLRQQLEILLAPAAMPIQDAIELADFLVGVCIGFSRFREGANSIGGPVEIAAITKHEGFRWVKRKHYFDATLNPA